jgi:hypothetical protein
MNGAIPGYLWKITFYAGFDSSRKTISRYRNFLSIGKSKIQEGNEYESNNFEFSQARFQFY